MLSDRNIINSIAKSTKLHLFNHSTSVCWVPATWQRWARLWGRSRDWGPCSAFLSNPPSSTQSRLLSCLGFHSHWPSDCRTNIQLFLVSSTYSLFCPSLTFFRLKVLPFKKQKTKNPLLEHGSSNKMSAVSLLPWAPQCPFGICPTEIPAHIWKKCTSKHAQVWSG